MNLADARAARPATADAGHRRGLVLAAVAVAALAGALWPYSAAATAEVDLVRLLRAMAVMKAALAAGAVAAVLWRLGAPASPGRLAGYAAACAAMAAGPGLIWSMGHVAAGAVLLHGGLLAAIVLLWRDPATAGRLARLIALRRSV